MRSAERGARRGSLQPKALLRGGRLPRAAPRRTRRARPPSAAADRAQASPSGRRGAARVPGDRLGSTDHTSAALDADGMLRQRSTCLLQPAPAPSVLVPGTGVHPRRRARRGGPQPATASAPIAPVGARLPSMMAPTVVLRDDGEVERRPAAAPAPTGSARRSCRPIVRAVEQRDGRGRGGAGAARALRAGRRPGRARAIDEEALRADRGARHPGPAPARGSTSSSAACRQLPAIRPAERSVAAATPVAAGPSPRLGPIPVGVPLNFFGCCRSGPPRIAVAQKVQDVPPLPEWAPDRCVAYSSKARECPDDRF